MKKIFLLLTVFSMVFASCDPLEDIYTEIDSQNNPIVGDANYSLTDDDYSDLGLNFGSFSSIDDVKTDIPPFLTEKYSAWGKGSTVNLNYKLFIGNAFSVSNYNLVQADYTLSGSTLLGFESTATPGDFLANIITANNASPKEGDYVSAQYFQFTGGAYTITPTISLEENLDYGTTAGDITTTSGGNWVNHSGSTKAQYAAENLTMTDYPSSNIGGSLAISSSGSEDINQAISPIITTNMVYTSALIKLSTVGNGTYFFHLMEEDGSFNYSARVGAKTDGAGKILFGIGASSSSLTYGTTAYDLDTTYLLVSSYDIETGIANLHVLTSVSSTEPTTPEATNTGNAGNSANRVGIRQGGGGPTALIDGIRVANTWSSIMSNSVLANEVVGNKVSNNANYVYTGGTWVLPTDGYYSVTDADFVSMGISSFGSSTSADDYLPTFLNIKFPFANVGDELQVLYNYVSSSSGAQVRGNSFTKTSSSAWSTYMSTIDKTTGFGHDGSVWVLDNTIKYTLTSSDYDLVGNSRFGNFDVRTGRDEETEASRVAKINTILLNNFPSDADGQKYLVSYNIFNGANGIWQLAVIKTGGAYVLQ